MAQVAAAVKVPLELILMLVKSTREVAALLETTFRGQQLQELLHLQGAQQGCDVSHLQKLCTSLLSSGDAALAAPVPALMQTAAAVTRAADAVQQRVGECLQALCALAAELRRHAETNHTVASELGRQPGCQELALERGLLARVQAELAERAAHVSRARGHCTLPPFADAVAALKAEAASKLGLLARPGAPAAAAAAAAAQPALRGEVQALAQGLQAVAAQVQQLVHAQQAQQAAPPQLQWAAAPTPLRRGAPWIQEISPGGTLQQSPVFAAAPRARPSGHIPEAQQQVTLDAPPGHVAAAPAATTRRASGLSLRGTRTEGDAAPPGLHVAAGAGANSASQPRSQGPQLTATPSHIAASADAPPHAAAAAHAVAPTPPSCGNGSAGPQGEEDDEEEEEGKENHDASQSQPAEGSGQQDVPATQPAPSDSEADGARREGGPPGGASQADRSAGSQPLGSQPGSGQVQQHRPAPSGVAAAVLDSQRDSTSPASRTLGSGGAGAGPSGAKAGSTPGGSRSGLRGPPRVGAPEDDPPAAPAAAARMPPPPPLPAAKRLPSQEQAEARRGKRARLASQVSSGEDPSMGDPLPGQPEDSEWYRAAGEGAPSSAPAAHFSTQPPSPQDEAGVAPSLSVWRTPATAWRAAAEGGTAPGTDFTRGAATAPRPVAGAAPGATPRFLPTGYTAGYTPLPSAAAFTPGDEGSLLRGAPRTVAQRPPHRLAQGAAAAGETPCGGSNQLRDGACE